MTSLPQLWGVLYAAPNANGERKACGNCRFFSNSNPAGVLMGRPGSRCDILPVPVTGEMVCGYHIDDTADPELAGLETVPGGTSCDTCRYYTHIDDTGGTCEATEGEDGGPAPVEALGCCARWEGADADIEPDSEQGY